MKDNKNEIDPILSVQKARLDYFRVRRTLLCNPTWQKTGAKGLSAAITAKDDIFGRQAKRLFTTCFDLSEKLGKGYGNPGEAEYFSFVVDDLIQQERTLPKDYMKIDLVHPENYEYHPDADNVYMFGSQSEAASTYQNNVIKSMGREKLLEDLRNMVRLKFTTITLSDPKFPEAKDFNGNWGVADNMSRMMKLFVSTMTQDLSDQEVLELFHNLDIVQTYEGLGMEDDVELREYCEQVFGDATIKFFTLMQHNMQAMAYSLGDIFTIAHPADIIKQGSPVLRDFIQSLAIYSNLSTGWDDRLIQKYGNNYNCDYDQETFKILGDISCKYVGIFTMMITPLSDEYSDDKEVLIEDIPANKPYKYSSMKEWRDNTKGVEKSLVASKLATAYFLAHPDLLDPDRIQKVKNKKGGDFFGSFATTPKLFPIVNNVGSIKEYRKFMKEHGLDYKTMTPEEVKNYSKYLKDKGYQTMLPTGGEELEKAKQVIADMKKTDPDFNFELEGNANMEKLYLNGFEGVTKDQFSDLLSEIKC